MCKLYSHFDTFVLFLSLSFDQLLLILHFKSFPEKCTVLVIQSNKNSVMKYRHRSCVQWAHGRGDRSRRGDGSRIRYTHLYADRAEKVLRNDLPGTLNKFINTKIGLLSHLPLHWTCFIKFSYSFLYSSGVSGFPIGSSFRVKSAAIIKL